MCAHYKTHEQQISIIDCARIMGNMGIRGWTAGDAVAIENEGWEVVGHEHEEQDGDGTATQAAIADCKHHD